MKIYIRSTGNISPQKTFGQTSFLTEPVWYDGNRLSCILPDYKGMIDPKLIRRMSRIIKMGVAAGIDCLQSAGSPVPDAIITGTAYGCLEDTDNFLKRLVENNEELLTPTSFIQSTHNTVGAQIALMLSCHNYNNTFVHRGFSFENALLDAQMLMAEREAKNVLVGSVDEITNSSYEILSRFGLYKKEMISTSQLIDSSTKGTVAGEGASFFLMSSQKQDRDSVCLDGFATMYKPSDPSAVQNFVESFLKSHSINISEIDVLMNGRNGDVKDDAVYAKIEKNIFGNTLSVSYKHLCGEYPTAVSFALWAAANIIKTNSIPVCLSSDSGKVRKIKKVLIYNHYQNIHHSLYLVSVC
jgi:3-oxoacyl-[acyl-carrier-protein] synthase II